MENENNQSISIERKKRTVLTKEVLLNIRSQINQGYNLVQIARINNFSYICIVKLAKKISSGLSDEQIIQKKGRKPEPNSELAGNLSVLISEDNAITQVGMVEELSMMGFNRTQSCISKMLKKIEITRKRLSKIPIERNSPNQITLRHAYAMEISLQQPSNLVFLDETGFNLHTSQAYGYSHKNNKAFINVNANRGLNQSLMCAINIHGIIGYEIQCGSFNGDRFIQFITSKLVSYFANNPSSILIMDNCRFHHRTDVIACLNANGIRYKFLPSYSPQLNPIEQFFSSIKARYKRITPRAKAIGQIHERLTSILDFFSDSLLGYYIEMRRVLDICLARQPLID